MKGHNYCSTCKKSVEPENVNFYEEHDACGTRVVFIEPDPRDTRISELEQCIRENYEALRDKRGTVQIGCCPEPRPLSIQEQSFMLKAESLIPTLKK